MSLQLPGPQPGGMCLFAYHKIAWESSGTKHLHHAALATGCSIWWKFPQQRTFPEDDPRLLCKCGAAKPSCPHLVWNCPETAHLRPLHSPVDRVEERLFAKVLRERPKPPQVPAYDSVFSDISLAVESSLQTSNQLVVATDGSAESQVASWSIVLPQVDRTFAGGVSGEDQSAYRAEVCAMHILLLVLVWMLDHDKSLPTQILFVSDCLSAISMVQFGQGAACLLAREIHALRSTCFSNGLSLAWQWVPSHGRIVPSWRPDCGFGEMQLRAWNDLADRKAKAQLRILLQTSPRVAWNVTYKLAVAWETDVIFAVSRIASFFESWDV